MWMKIAATFGAILLASPLAMAQAPSEGAGGRMAACRADLASLCQGVEAGGGRKTACLEQNRDKLSPDCRQAIEQRQSRRDARGGGSGPPSGQTAQSPPGSEPQATGGRGGKRGGGRMAACRTDVATFCAASEKGRARGQCLRENHAKLSPECQAVIAQRVQTAGRLREACKADRQALCGTIQRGGGRMLQCLRENKDKVSAACSEALTTLPPAGKGRTSG